jgi:hypothetical protein
VYDNWGCEVSIRIPVVKLIDYRQDKAALEQSPNPFAAVILAQLKVLETRHEPATRWQWKLRLVKGLYDRGLKKEQVRQLFRVLDWMLALRPELDQSFRGPQCWSSRDKPSRTPASSGASRRASRYHPRASSRRPSAWHAPAIACKVARSFRRFGARAF